MSETQPEFVGELDCVDDVRPATLFCYQTLLLADRGLSTTELSNRTGLATRSVRRGCVELEDHNLVKYYTDPRNLKAKIVVPIDAEPSDAWDDHFHDPEPVA